MKRKFKWYYIVISLFIFPMLCFLFPVRYESLLTHLITTTYQNYFSFRYESKEKRISMFQEHQKEFQSVVDVIEKNKILDIDDDSIPSFEHVYEIDQNLWISTMEKLTRDQMDQIKKSSFAENFRSLNLKRVIIDPNKSVELYLVLQDNYEVGYVYSLDHREWKDETYRKQKDIYIQNKIDDQWVSTYRLYRS